MTAQDRQYMVDVDDPNLRAFLDWHTKATNNGSLTHFTWYAQLKMAFMAGKNSLRQPELAPSRDVLPPAPMRPLAKLPMYPPEADLIQHGTVTGRIPPLPEPAMDSLYPLPNSPKTWSGEPVRIQAPETKPMRVVPADFELVDSVDLGHLPVVGPVEDI